MLYADFVSRISELTAISATNPDFLAILPGVIDDAEQRIYRELQLVSTSARNSAFALTAGSRNLVLATGTFVIVTGVNVITPYGIVNPELGTRVQLTAVRWDVLDAIYGTSSPAVPRYYALQDSSTIAFGPWPDQSYRVEILGTIRPAPLSASNPSTFISLYLPDLFTAAAMVFMAGYMQDFGRQSDDPTMAMSWEALYQSRKASAAAEEQFKQAMTGP